jgi:pyruvate dehydrogenase E1 component
LAGDAPVIASTDYVRAWPQLIASYLDAPFTAPGTDGFGRSDTRAALRHFFEVDRHHVVLAALPALRHQGQVDATTCAEAIARYGLSPDALPSWLA